MKLIRRVVEDATYSVKHACRAFGYSLKGYRAAHRNEWAFRQEIRSLFLVVPLGLWLGDDGVQRALLIGSWLLVIIVELLNSAVEAAVDRVGTEHNELAGRAKDLGSAAVLCAIVLAAFTWGLILFG